LWRERGERARRGFYLLQVRKVHELRFVWKLQLFEYDGGFPWIWPYGVGVECNGFEGRHVQKGWVVLGLCRIRLRIADFKVEFKAEEVMAKYRVQVWEIKCTL
jgi:hypothetical protein